jgi:hypothetical protein
MWLLYLLQVSQKAEVGCVWLCYNRKCVSILYCKSVRLLVWFMKKECFLTA